MTKRNVVAIVNGAAGGGRCRARFEQLRPRLEATLALDVRVTERAAHASVLAREAYQAGARDFLVVGGDGTGFEVVDGLFPAASGDVTLSMLPLGTGNSFLRDFGVVGEEAALRAIASGTRRPVDVVRLTHRDGVVHYINLFGLGFTASVGKLTNDRFKALGALGYVAAVVLQVVKLEHPLDPIRSDGGTLDARPAAMLVFSNSQYTGGAMHMAPHADVADGAVDVIRVGALSRGRLLAAFPKIFQGTHVHVRDVEEGRARVVEFTAPRKQPCMIDGEILELEPLRLEVLPKALTVIA